MHYYTLTVSLLMFFLHCVAFTFTTVLAKHLLFTDIDECHLGTDDCDVNGECNNTVGSFSCYCKPGYSGDGRNCCK